MLRIAFFLNVLDYARGIAELVPFAVDDTNAFVYVEMPDLLERLVAELVKDAAQIKAPDLLNNETGSGRLREPEKWIYSMDSPI